MPIKRHWRWLRKMKNRKVLNQSILVLLLIAFCTVSALAVQNKGAANMSLEGGKRGVVPFPHDRHQSKLNDCNVCHTLFPQEKRSIRKQQKEGRLTKKQVMNKLCIKCHKAEKRAGRPSGPLTCKQCHVRN